MVTFDKVGGHMKILNDIMDNPYFHGVFYTEGWEFL